LRAVGRDVLHPHVHNLAFLRTQAERLDVRLVHVWPGDTASSGRCSRSSRKPTSRRYSKHYRITEEELAWLGEQVEELGRVVHAICSERIAQLEMTARQAG
jgi:hypothetical protein